MRRPLISDQWAREYHSEDSTGFRNGIMITPLTFCGVLEDLYLVIARNWNDVNGKYFSRKKGIYFSRNAANYFPEFAAFYFPEFMLFYIKPAGV